MKKSYANLMLLFVTVIWGGGFIATSGALDSLSPFCIMTIRFLGAAVLPLILSWKALKEINKEVWRCAVLTGVFLFLAFAFQTFGLQYTTASKNAFLTATNVVFVPYLLWLLMKRRPSRKEMIASLLCMIGIALLTLNPAALVFDLGDMLSLICAVFFALHIIALERYSSHINAFSFTAVQMLTAGVLSLICMMLFEGMPTYIEPSAFSNLLYLIFVSTMLAYLLQTYAQKFTTANSASLILSMEALFASLFSFLFLKEVLSVTMMIGALLIFASIIFLEYKPAGKHT